VLEVSNLLKEDNYCVGEDDYRLSDLEMDLYPKQITLRYAHNGLHGYVFGKGLKGKYIQILWLADALPPDKRTFMIQFGDGFLEGQPSGVVSFRQFGDAVDALRKMGFVVTVQGIPDAWKDSYLEEEPDELFQLRLRANMSMTTFRKRIREISGQELEQLTSLQLSELVRKVLPDLSVIALKLYHKQKSLLEIAKMLAKEGILAETSVELAIIEEAQEEIAAFVQIQNPLQQSIAVIDYFVLAAEYFGSFDARFHVLAEFVALQPLTPTHRQQLVKLIDYEEDDWEALRASAEGYILGLMSPLRQLAETIIHSEN
jgi:hypothetical protein